jgi:hypothetical protein
MNRRISKLRKKNKFPAKTIFYIHKYPKFEFINQRSLVWFTQGTLITPNFNINEESLIIICDYHQ